MPTQLTHTHTTEAIKEVEDFVLERFQQNLIRSLTDLVRQISLLGFKLETVVGGIRVCNGAGQRCKD